MLHLMVDDQRRLDHAFSALADPTRRAMLRRLAEAPATVSQLAQPFPISLAAVSKHVGVLERAGLISRDVRGRTHHITLAPAGFEAASAFIGATTRFWAQRLDQLETYLGDAGSGDASPPPPARRHPPHPRNDSRDDAR